MKLNYDRETDTLTIVLRDTDIRESDEVRPGVIADLAANGEIVRLEILDASRRVDDPAVVELATSASA